MLKYIEENISHLLQERDYYQFVDFICIKTNSDISMIKAYCFEGHPFYEKYINDGFKLLTRNICELGCFGISEIPFDMSLEKLRSEKIEIRLNITDDEQYAKVQELVLSNCEITDELSAILHFLGSMDLQTDKIADYRSLYFCGITKEEKNDTILGASLYYKTFCIVESVEQSKRCIEYLEQSDRLANDGAFIYAKKMVLNELATLKSIGIDILRNGKFKIKYYLRIKDDSTLYNHIIPYYMNAHSLNNMDFKGHLEYILDFESLEFNCIQITSGFNMGKYSINLYFSPSSNLKKRTYYCLRSGLVLRDIAGIFFIVDTKDKHYYDVKKLYRVNEIGKSIFDFASQHGVFTVDAVVSYLKLLLVDYTPNMYNTIFMDCLDFIRSLVELGYMKEVN